MEVQLPKIKTVRVMLAGMTAQQESVFKMAFKFQNGIQNAQYHPL